ncbi:MAG TPA: hypothetical protein V6D00_10415 [Pantanalinema sp.]
MPKITNQASLLTPFARPQGPEEQAPAAKAAPPQPRLAGDALKLSSALAQASVPVSPPPHPMAKLGGTDYYRARYEDFQRRHPGMEAPSYYLNYGEKYAKRFTEELAPKLSPAGQAWLAQARLNLQVAIEARLKADPRAFDQLELDDEAFKQFAYDTHPEAYLSAGMERLPLKDLVRIGLTPDTKDLFTVMGLEQVAEVAAGLAAAHAKDYLDRGLKRLPSWMTT